MSSSSSSSGGSGGRGAAAAAAAPVLRAAPGFTIDLSKPRYDQSTYWGRVRHFVGIIDPLTLFTTDAKLSASLGLLKQYEQKLLPPGTTEEDVWEAKRTKDSIIHPDTKEPVFLPFRMSAFVPVNIPIVVGMLNSRSVASILFWQWANQSYNVAVNYANRNASNPMSNQSIAVSYAAAVLTSCSLGVGLGRLTDKLAGPTSTFPGPIKYALKTFVPYVAVASAGAMNVALMRGSEMKEGIAVQDKDGKTVGQSIYCGKKALAETVLTRVALPAPILMLPPVLMSGFDAVIPSLKAQPRLRIPLEVAVATSCLWACLPLSIGLFPQQSSAPVSKLEPHFQNLKTKDGQPLREVYFNKGL